jgi:hypothetical protein
MTLEMLDCINEDTVLFEIAVGKTDGLSILKSDGRTLFGMPVGRGTSEGFPADRGSGAILKNDENTFEMLSPKEPVLLTVFKVLDSFDSTRISEKDAEVSLEGTMLDAISDGRDDEKELGMPKTNEDILEKIPIRLGSELVSMELVSRVGLSDATTIGD